MEDKINELEKRINKLEFIVAEQGTELDTLHNQVQGLRGITDTKKKNKKHDNNNTSAL